MADNQERQPYMEDADEDGNPIDDTKTFGSVKEEANTSRTRKDAKGSGGSSPQQHDSDSEGTPQSSLKRVSSKRRREPGDREKEKLREREGRKSIQNDKTGRPRARSSQTLPNLQTSSSRKQQDRPSRSRGSPTKLTPSPIITTAGTAARPRAYTANQQRPASYYGPSASRPPPTRFYPTPPFGTSFPPLSPQAYPPPQSPMHMPYHAPFVPPPPHPFAHPPPDYFGQVARPIPMSRLDYRRPSSALGRERPFHHSPLAYSPDYEDNQEGSGALIRRPSLKTRPTRQEQEELDRARMPPPTRRPSTSGQTRSPFAPPGPTRSNRRSIGSITSLDYDDDSVDDDSLLSASDQTQYNYQPLAALRPSVDPESVYDFGSRHEQVAGGRPSRRNSVYHGGRTRSAERDLEDKIQSARRYQEKVDGPVNSLTADSLRQISRTASQGTKSTRSRGGETGYETANRTSADMSDDMRILVRGTATLTIGDAHMDVRDGAEIRIPTTSGGDRTSRGGSDQGGSGSALYDERDRRRLLTGARDQRRAASQAAPHARLPPPPPPPTEYGGSYYGYPGQVPLYAPPGSHGFAYPYHP